MLASPFLLSLISLAFFAVLLCSAVENIPTQGKYYAKVDAERLRSKYGLSAHNENGEQADSVNYCNVKSPSSKSSDGVRLPLAHVYSQCSPFRQTNSTWLSLVLQSVEDDEKRYKALLHRSTASLPENFNPPQDAANEPLASGRVFNTGNYIVKIGIGAPVQSFYTVIDTGSDIAFIPCNPCSGCDSNATAPFDSSKSSSYRSLRCAEPKCQQLGNRRGCTAITSDCNFSQEYADGSTFQAVFSSDKLTVGSDSFNNFYFGCAHLQTGLLQTEPGLIGLGRNALSFLSQTAGSYDNTFSYCLPRMMSTAFSGSLYLGKGDLSASGLKFTPLLTNPVSPSLYYIGLMGISVGGEPVSIPPGTFALDKSNGGGTIIDSGNVFTRLVKPAYIATRDAFRLKFSNQTKYGPTAASGFDTCYDISSGTIDVPTITLHFQNDLDLLLPPENILLPLNAEATTVCLAFALPPEGQFFSVISSFGNYQQQNLRVVYDIPNSQLGFAEENCSA